MDLYYLLKLALTVLFGLVLGAISSIPVGAVQLVVIKKALNHQIKPAIAVACGSMTSDFIYGALTLFGFGSFLHNRDFQIVTYSVGVLVLAYILYRTIRERAVMLQTDELITYKKRYAFIKGFTIAITNPGMIIWWLVGYKLFLDTGLFVHVPLGVRILFVISGCAGLGGYLFFIGHVVYRAKKSLPDNFVHRAYLFLSVLLFCLIAYFIIKIVCTIYNIETVI